MKPKSLLISSLLCCSLGLAGCSCSNTASSSSADASEQEQNVSSLESASDASKESGQSSESSSNESNDSTSEQSSHNSDGNSSDQSSQSSAAASSKSPETSVSSDDSAASESSESPESSDNSADSAASSSEQNNSTDVSAASHSVIAEIGTLDSAPIPLKEGWIVQQNGNYGILSPDGSWITEETWPNMVLMPDASGKMDGFLSNNSGEAFNLATMSVSQAPGGLGGASDGYYYLNADNQLCFLTNDGTSSEASSSENQTITLPKGEVSSITGGYEYYIYTPSQQIFGPYSPDTRATFNWDEMSGQIYSSISLNIPVYGLFWAENADGTCSVYTADGSSHLDGFESALPLSNEYMLVKGSDGLQVINQDLKSIYQCNDQSVSAPIDGAVLIENGNSWSLVNAG